MATPPPTLRLIFWPLLLTTLLSVVRLVGEVQGSITSASGGAGSPLGITWLIFVFGGWFGYRLARQGSRPTIQPAWLLWLLVLGGVAGAFYWVLLGADLDGSNAAAQQQLGALVLKLAAIASCAALLALAIWPRLAWTLLCYAVGARLVVLGITMLAKAMAWDTHYTKFGPAGFELDMTGTLQGAALAQLGFWVPMTILAGGFVGSWFGRR